MNVKEIHTEDSSLQTKTKPNKQKTFFYLWLDFLQLLSFSEH